MSFSRHVAAALVGGALLLPDSGVEAQNRTGARAAPVEVFTVSGARTPPPMPGVQSNRSTDEVAEPGMRPARAVPAADGARTAAMSVLSSRRGARPGGTGAIQAQAPTELQDITLTARRPWVNNRAYLSYLFPATVNSSTGTVMFSRDSGFATVYLNAAEGALYLVDFAVDAWGIGTYRVASGDNAQTFPNSNGQQHLMVAVQATTAGWVSVQLSRSNGSGYYIHEVRVTRVD